MDLSQKVSTKVISYLMNDSIDLKQTQELNKFFVCNSDHNCLCSFHQCEVKEYYGFLRFKGNIGLFESNIHEDFIANLAYRVLYQLV
jgi:hypothetical protein